MNISFICFVSRFVGDWNDNKIFKRNAELTSGQVNVLLRREILGIVTLTSTKKFDTQNRDWHENVQPWDSPNNVMLSYHIRSCKSVGHVEKGLLEILIKVKRLSWTRKLDFYCLGFLSNPSLDTFDGKSVKIFFIIFVFFCLARNKIKQTVCLTSAMKTFAVCLHPMTQSVRHGLKGDAQLHDSFSNQINPRVKILLINCTSANLTRWPQIYRPRWAINKKGNS